MKKALISLSLLFVLAALVTPMVGCAKKEEPAETAVETTTETSGTEMTSEMPMGTEMTSEAAPMTTGK
ncbi:MAG: hypothetical protein ABJC13_09765 [Acidobacteriota bacterium]